jgi:SH3-like domain-containing protein
MFVPFGIHKRKIAILYLLDAGFRKIHRAFCHRLYIEQNLFMQYAACKLPAAPVRKKPFHQSEMTNQLLFGETVEVLKEKKKWIKIKSLFDGYNGWMVISQLTEVDEETAVTNHPYVSSELLNLIETGESKMNIPVGSTLPRLMEIMENWA